MVDERTHLRTYILLARILGPLQLLFLSAALIDTRPETKASMDEAPLLFILWFGASAFGCCYLGYRNSMWSPTAESPEEHYDTSPWQAWRTLLLTLTVWPAAALSLLSVGGTVAKLAGFGFIQSGSTLISVADSMPNPFPPSSPSHRHYLAYMRQLEALPGFQERILAEKSDQETAESSAAMAAAGLLRLDNTMLVTRMKVMVALLEAAEADECIYLVNGAESGMPLYSESGGSLHDVLMRVLGRLHESDVADYFAVNLQATNAVLSGNPEKDTSLIEEDNAMQELFTLIPRADQVLLKQILAKQDSATPDESCWANKTLLANAMRTSEPARGTLARMFVKPDKRNP